MKHVLYTAPLLALLAMPTGVALAACTLPAATASLGTVTSFAINSAVSGTSAAMQVNCGAGSLAALLSSNYISLQLTGATNASGHRAVLKHDNGTDAIPIQLCSTQNCSTELTINGSPVKYGPDQLVNLIGLMGGSNFSIPLYIRTQPGQTVAAGSYSGILNVLVTYAICTGIGALGQCLPGSSQSGSAVEPLSVSLTIANDCVTITAPNVNFGSAPLISGFNTVAQSITVVCTKGSSYTVGLSNGGNAVDNVRHMASGGALLSYDIYRGTGNDRWGSTGSARWSSALSTSVSSDGVQRTYSYVAKILQAQPTPPPGNYTDSLIVDLAF